MKSLILLLLLAPAAVAAPAADPSFFALERELKAAREDFEKGRVAKERHEAYMAEFKPRFEAAVRNSLETPENSAARARIMAMLGEGAGAQEVLRRTIAANPKDEGLQTSLGQVQIESGNYAGALATANKILERDPTNKNALFLKYLSEKRSQGISGSSTISGPGRTSASDSPPSGRPAAKPAFEFTPSKPRTKTVVPGFADAEIPRGESPSALDLDAMLPAYTLQNYSEKEKAELRRAIIATEAGTKEFYRKIPSRVADIGGGLASNLVQGFDIFFGARLRAWGIDFSAPERSCINHQEALAQPVLTALGEGSGLKAEYIDLGAGFEHHAIVLHPKDSNIVRSGVVLDPWRKQSSRPVDFVYPYTTWKGIFMLNALGGERRGEINRVDP
jgi:tetratricopeptide (TPR) repeat protein